METALAGDGDFRHLAADCRHPTPSEYRVDWVGAEGEWGGGGGEEKRVCVCVCVCV